VHVLIMDERADDRDLLVRLLNRHGGITARGLACIEAATVPEFDDADVIVINLPSHNRDAVPLIASIDRLRVDGRPTVLVHATSMDDREWSRLRAAGAGGLVLKGVGPHELIDGIVGAARAGGGTESR
jgi:DNA-binding NarL/FixJ family response regulator